ncbi:FAD-dependent monooxygenase [Streptomyces litchfieldiae]|uniref:FAD-dependent monooxygenase n=1 Tax=Streptomyces litchfieldiae TaxID=3075543 RepID=A0ABU2MWS2_9ACTN|nr:FAD-dependent monooxygenase [Streptomyces sp. DSM 44938]MDT0345822.1 FAD-dependent monooxygenase [Streptomyces sp. DSM 44938]
MADVLVADGGIGGLTAALSVARQRHRVTVLERAGAYQEVEAGIRLSSGVLDALDRLDIGDAVRERAASLDELSLVEGNTGQRLVSLSTATDECGHGAGSPVVIRRLDLFEILLDACRRIPHIDLVTDSGVTHYEQDGERVTAFLESGERRFADALIGAGGACSTIGRQLAGRTPPDSRRTYYHAVVPAEHMPESLKSNALTVWARPRWQFVVCPIDTGGYYDLSVNCDNDAEDADPGTPVPAERVLSDCLEAAEDVRVLIGLGGDWKMWVTRDTTPVSQWADGRVVLTGDALHLPLPFISHHTCHLAVEDAVRLGELMDCDAADFPQVFRSYGVRRDALATKARKRVLCAVSQEGMYDRIPCLHGM